LIQATDGNFYGTTSGGGANNDGTVFKITPSGALTTLHSFEGTDGVTPEAGLVQATNGNLYGTTSYGGANGSCFGNGCGTVFKVTTSGILTTVHYFDGTDGSAPQAGQIQATNGEFYGIASSDGADGFGTVFKMAPNGVLTTLYNFCSQSNCTDGKNPEAGLV
jgi:uncharacterized repeat protein (TIGR03803 family)